jgi:hypothetical protein
VDNIHKVLHVGPDTCSVVSKLLREEEIEAWGVEPYLTFLTWCLLALGLFLDYNYSVSSHVHSDWKIHRSSNGSSNPCSKKIR